MAGQPPYRHGYFMISTHMLYITNCRGTLVVLMVITWSWIEIERYLTYRTNNVPEETISNRKSELSYVNRNQRTHPNIEWHTAYTILS